MDIVAVVIAAVEQTAAWFCLLAMAHIFSTAFTADQEIFFANVD